MAKSAAVKPPKKPLKNRLWDQRYLFLLMLPAVVWVVFICYAPMTGLYMAFTNYSPTTEATSMICWERRLWGWTGLNISFRMTLL